MSTEANELGANKLETELEAEFDAEVEEHVGLPVHHGEKAHPSDWFYVKIALALALLTAMEVTASYLDLGAVFLPLLIVLMTIKFVMVVLFFMHLKYDHAIFGRLFWSGLILALSVYLAALATFHVFSSSG